MIEIPMLASVALTVDVPEKGLTRGEMGTVVEFLGDPDEGALLVEFSDERGQTYAMADLRPEQLLVLHRQTEAA